MAVALDELLASFAIIDREFADQLIAPALRSGMNCA
jgi:hypothetical protein